MSSAELAAFLGTYERWTAWLLERTPLSADLLLDIGEDHEALGDSACLRGLSG